MRRIGLMLVAALALGVLVWGQNKLSITGAGCDISLSDVFEMV